MKVALIGYGKMGKAIERILQKRGHDVVYIIDRNTDTSIAQMPDNVDVVVEFTEPSSAFDNIMGCLQKGVPIVSGTTGWMEHKQEVEAACMEHKGAFFWASNFSLGVNLFFALNQKLAQLMNQHPGYDVSMSETHHTEKKDAPSGTAITLAEGLIDNLERVSQWTLKGEQEKEHNGVEIEALREPKVPGTHEVVYTSDMDEIMIRHTAHTRDSFALGAVLAAEWLKGKQGLFTMSDMLGF